MAPDPPDVIDANQPELKIEIIKTIISFLIVGLFVTNF